MIRQHPHAARDPGLGENQRGFTVEMARDAQQCRQASDLLNLVWQMPEGQDVLELSTLVAYVHSGCYVATAREVGTGEVIAASVGFFGPPGTSLHSHITGVHPSWAGRGVGRAMKEHQRAWCLERGVSAITWTFDPLVARNAFFNLATLGARATAFLPDHYGQMTDGRNAGHGSDRLLVTWDATDHQPPDGPSGASRHVALADHEGRPGTPITHVPDVCEEVEIAVPLDIEALRENDPELAAAWRAGAREAFDSLLADGWTVSGIERPARYLLTRPEDPREMDR